MGLLLTRLENELRGTSVHRNVLSTVFEHIGSTKAMEVKKQKFN